MPQKWGRSGLPWLQLEKRNRAPRASSPHPRARGSSGCFPPSIFGLGAPPGASRPRFLPSGPWEVTAFWGQSGRAQSAAAAPGSGESSPAPSRGCCRAWMRIPGSAGAPGTLRTLLELSGVAAARIWQQKIPEFPVWSHGDEPSPSRAPRAPGWALGWHLGSCWMCPGMEERLPAPAGDSSPSSSLIQLSALHLHLDKGPGHTLTSLPSPLSPLSSCTS